jgi:hypothetical protein
MQHSPAYQYLNMEFDIFLSLLLKYGILGYKENSKCYYLFIYVHNIGTA